MFETLRRDIQAAWDRDPAARSTREVILCARRQPTSAVPTVCITSLATHAHDRCNKGMQITLGWASWNGTRETSWAHRGPLAHPPERRPIRTRALDRNRWTWVEAAVRYSPPPRSGSRGSG